MCSPVIGAADGARYRAHTAPRPGPGLTRNHRRRRQLIRRSGASRDVPWRSDAGLSVRLRRRCVLIVHGQGLHSTPTRDPGPVPGRALAHPAGATRSAGGYVADVAVLRDLVIADLIGKASGLVHAFAPAAPSDGGRGATYVMLRCP